MSQSNVLAEEIRPRALYSIDQILGVSSSTNVKNIGEFNSININL